MDARVDTPHATGTPHDVSKSSRALGGKFDAAWPSLADKLHAFVNGSMERGALNLSLVTYHLSACNNKLYGCAGWEGRVQDAQKHMNGFKRDLDYIYGRQMTTIVTGVETDTDMWILHAPNGTLPTKELIGFSLDQIHQAIHRAFPTMEDQVLRDLAPFLLGNARRVQHLLQNPRAPHELGHREWIIALGEEFEWLSGKAALIINPDDPNLDFAICKAASIIQNNLLTTLPTDKEILLFTSLPYEEEDSEGTSQEKRSAQVGARNLLRFAEEHIRNNNPTLWNSGRLRTLATVIRRSTKQLEPVTLTHS
jgi:hypothetical protein